MTKMMSAAALAVALAAAAASPAAQQAELALAMIRPDGILTPFAVFDGKTWTAAWPEPQDKMVLDRMIEAMPSWWRTHQRPIPPVWHVVRPGQPTLKVNVLKPIVFGEHCGNQTGLLTDMRPRRVVDSIPLSRMLATDRLIAVDAAGPPTTSGPRGEGRVTRRPMGTFKAGGSTFRVVLVIGYEGEGISLLQIGPDGEREVLDTYIGGC